MASVEIPAISILIGFFLSYLAFGAASNIAAEEKASGSVVVTGYVFCDACLEGRPSENGYVISGASVAAEFRVNRKTMMTVSIRGETDEKGEFKVKLPLNIFESADLLNMCSVKLLKSPDKFCGIPSKSAPASSLTLQSSVNGVLTYSAGSFSYRHETAPGSCYRKGVVRMKKGLAVAENFDENWIRVLPLVRMKKGRAVAENFDENWKRVLQTDINPDPFLHRGAGRGSGGGAGGGSGWGWAAFPKFPAGAPWSRLSPWPRLTPSPSAPR